MTSRRRRRPAKAEGDISTYIGRQLVGRVVFLGDEWRAELADGRSIGLFATRSEAREAISEARRAAK